MKANRDLSTSCFLHRRVAKLAGRAPTSTAWIDVDSKVRADRDRWLRQQKHLRAQLVARGIDSNSTVAYVGPNHWLTWTLALATWNLGAGFWPINYRWTARELKDVTAAWSRTPDLVVGTGPGLRVCRKVMGDVVGVEIVDRQWFIDSIHNKDKGDSTADAFTAPADFASESDETARLIMSTGGTTGTPRMVALDAHKLATGAGMFRQMTGLDDSDRVVVCAPNFHVAGFAALTTAALQTGSALIIVAHFDAEAVVEAIFTHQATATVLVPSLWRRLFDSAGPVPEKLSTLRFGICGGAPMSPDLVDRARRFDVELLQGYGMTEAGPMVTLMPPGAIDDGPPRRRASAGIAPDDISVRILNEDLRDVPVDQPGQIAVRGPNITDHYLTDSSDKRSDVHQGHLLTGDCGYFDEDRFLYVTGRLDNMVITGGESVAPAEVEAQLAADPAIDEVAAFGIDDDHWGQRLVAVATSSAKTPAKTAREVLCRSRQRLADYKVPRQLRWVEEIPKTPAGKVSRSRLRSLWSSRFAPCDAPSDDEPRQ